MKAIKAVNWRLVCYDLLIMICVQWLLLVFYRSNEALSAEGVTMQALICLSCVFLWRGAFKVHRQIWRYGGIQCYMRLLCSDAAAFLSYVVIEITLPIEHITFARMMSISSMILLGCLAMRMCYRYAYRYSNNGTRIGSFFNYLLRLFSGGRVIQERAEEKTKVNMAIIGAGKVGAALVNDLLSNPESIYRPVCFVDVNTAKAGKELRGLPVIGANEATLEYLKDYDVQEVVIAISKLTDDQKRGLHNHYSQAGFKVRAYDYPLAEGDNSKRTLRDFDIEELLFRNTVRMSNDNAKAYYSGKKNSDHWRRRIHWIGTVPSAY